MAEKKEFLTYKGKPLVRQGNTIYYGDMADDYVIMMQILAKKEVGDKDKAEVASKVSVQLLSTDPNASMKERIIKTSEKKVYMRQWTLLKFGCKEHSHTNKKKRRTEKSVQRFIFFLLRFCSLKP